MSDSLRGERLQILLTTAELEALDNWRFAHRMPSRAAAIRELLKRGLSSAASPAGNRTRSKDFRVVRDGEAEDDMGLTSKVDRRSGTPAD